MADFAKWCADARRSLGVGGPKRDHGLFPWGSIWKIFFSLCLAVSMTTNASAINKFETAVFAGGCFWCMTPPFEKLKGVLKVTAGYTDGKGPDPTYEDYAEKGYTEAVEIIYDPAQVKYSQLLDVFWRQINPTDPDGQFVDRGPAYRAAVMFLDENQKKSAEKSREALDQSGRYDKPVVTKILKFRNFYAAEDYHQGYYKKNPVRYELYHINSGRVQYLEKIWGKGKH